MSESFVVRVTTLPEEILKAQKLRYTVYYKERMRTLSEDVDVDEDIFDAHCEHLIVEEVSNQRIVGTYRLISRKVSECCGAFYSQNEFNIQKILESKDNILELGRACVERPYRTKGVIRLLWKGLADYINRHNVRYLFGCASFDGVVPDRYQHGFSYLHYAYLAPEYIRPEVLPSGTALIDLLEPEKINIHKAWSQIPPLLRSYIQVGGWVGKGIFQDFNFSSLDACVVVDTKRLVQSYGS